MNIEEIKLGLELWDNRLPFEPPSDKHAEILYDTVKRRAKKFENNDVENVRYLLSIIEQAEKAFELFEQLYDPNINKATSEVIETVKTMASKALQAIRGK